MKQFEYTIKDEYGIHARPAGMLVKVLQGFESEITITHKEKTIDGKKLFALMGLAVKQNETITVTANGTDEQLAIKTAEDFLNENL